MRDLDFDLEWLKKSQFDRDLSDEYLRETRRGLTREAYQNYAPEFAYGITFVESDIAREWLERAIEAERKLEETMRRRRPTMHEEV